MNPVLQAPHGSVSGVVARPAGRRFAAVTFFALILCCARTPSAEPLPESPPVEVRVEMPQGSPEISSASVMRAGASSWDPAYKGQLLRPGDRLRTGRGGRLILLLPDGSSMQVGEFSDVEIQHDPASQSRLGLFLRRARLYFLHRGSPTDLRIGTQTASAAVRGTEFELENSEPEGAGHLRIAVISGRVSLQNRHGAILLDSGQEGLAEATVAPAVRPILETVRLVQWCLYYPAILDLKDLRFPSTERTPRTASMTAFSEGDLLAAFASHPAGDTPESPEEALFSAALMLAVGKVPEAEAALAMADTGSDLSDDAVRRHRVAAALRRLIAVVRGVAVTNSSSPALATEWLAESYHCQSRWDLRGALEAARAAVTVSPDFPFAWAQLAELELSFGRVREAKRAVDRALALAPKQAQAMALRGFLAAAEDRLLDALSSFDHAISLDPHLANAWLGRGLTRRRGELRLFLATGSQEWRRDLEVAALLEPRRSLLRSYLGKALADSGERSLAIEELARARELDPNDPTPWLYSALLAHNRYHTAEAIHDLERSQHLNDNRAVYRSRLLLDEDQSVRSANLAIVFRDAGLTDLGIRESARAVSLDYANHSAHLNLAGGLYELRDPTRFNLRYETAWFNEHLLASLLAPSGGAQLSQSLSQQEYSRLLAGNRIGASGTTEYLGTGDFRQVASQYGDLGRSSYAFDLDYQHREGDRPNNDLSRIEWYTRFKQVVTPDDSALLLIKYQDYDGGDNFQYLDPASARPRFRITETQEPLLLTGWHHQWSPGAHTLLLAGRLVNDQRVTDVEAGQRVAIVNPPAMFDPTNTVPLDLEYRSRFETWSAELNQILQREHHTDILGVRYQDGAFEADAALDHAPTDLAPLFDLPQRSRADASLQRISVYAYHHWEILPNLIAIGGLAYDHLTFPANYRRPPLSSDESERDCWQPKAALLWDITPGARLRGMFARSLGGVSYDQSVRLEPTQLAGFPQAFRSVIPESMVGSVEAPEHDIGGAALDLRPWTNAWLSLQAQVTHARVDRQSGLFELDFLRAPAGLPAQTEEGLDFLEWQGRILLNQMLLRDWFLEGSYQISRTELQTTLPTIPATLGFDRTTTSAADLHELQFATTWGPPYGPFARAEVHWYLQALSVYPEALDPDPFAQVNLYIGYRFPRRRADLVLGILNLSDEDYRLSPLNYHPELPRERALYVRFRFEL